MFTRLAAAAFATLALSTPVFAQAAGNGVSTPAEEGTLVGPSHRSNRVNSGMGEGRATAPDTNATDNNSVRRRADNSAKPDENEAARNYGH